MGTKEKEKKGLLIMISIKQLLEKNVIKSEFRPSLNIIHGVKGEEKDQKRKT